MSQKSNALITTFFGIPKQDSAKLKTAELPKGPPNGLPNGLPKGLIVIENYVSVPEQERLLAAVNKQTWLNLLKRRVQHYGYEYDYQKRSAITKIGDLPDFTKELTNSLVNNGYFETTPDQLIINEYTPGQGIAAHTDALVFGDPVASLSLGSSCMFTFTRSLPLGTEEKFELFLKPGTLVVMSGESRYQWKHAIIPRKSDVYQDKTIKRDTRVSLTFRIMRK